MPFDPTKPFDVISNGKQSSVGFDPTKPFETIQEPEELNLGLTPQSPEYGDGLVGGAISDVDSAFKGALGQAGSLAAAIPANIAEVVGVDSEDIRKSQEYWQGLTQEARDELVRHPEWAKKALFMGANPLAYTATTPAALFGLGAGEEAMDIAATGDRTGATLQDVKDVATSGAIDATVGKAIDAVSPIVTSQVKTRYGELIDKLPVDAKRKANIALGKIDEIGGKDLSEDTRGKLLADIDFNKDVSSVDNQIKASLVDAEREAFKKSQDAYNLAKPIAGRTDKFNTRKVIDVLRKDKDGNLDVPTKEFKKKYRAYKEIKSILSNNPNANAADIEKKLRTLKEDQRAGKSNVSYLYSRAIDELEKQQKDLLKTAKDNDGNTVDATDIFTEARELWKDWSRDFTGDISGTGQTGGKSIDSVLTANDNAGTARDLVGGKIDANLAEQIGKNFSKQEKRDMAFNVLIDGIDTKDVLNTPENVSKLIQNFRSASSVNNARGIRELLGDDGYMEVKRTIDALDFTQEAIKIANKEDTSIARDVLEMGAAAAAIKVSPYAAVHVAINKSKNILDKTLLKSDKAQLVKRVKGIKDTAVRNRLLKTLAVISPADEAIKSNDKRESAALTIKDENQLSLGRQDSNDKIFDINASKPQPFKIK